MKPIGSCVYEAVAGLQFGPQCLEAVPLRTVRSASIWTGPRLGLAWSGLAWSGVFGLFWPVRAYSGLAWFGVMQCDLNGPSHSPCLPSSLCQISTSVRSEPITATATPPAPTQPAASNAAVLQDG